MRDRAHVSGVISVLLIGAGVRVLVAAEFGTQPEPRARTAPSKDWRSSKAVANCDVTPAGGPGYRGRLSSSAQSSWPVAGAAAARLADQPSPGRAAARELRLGCHPFLTSHTQLLRADPGALTCFVTAARECRSASLGVTELGVDTGPTTSSSSTRQHIVSGYRAAPGLLSELRRQSRRSEHRAVPPDRRGHAAASRLAAAAAGLG